MSLCSHYISRKAVDILIFPVDKKLSYVVQLTCVTQVVCWENCQACRILVQRNTVFSQKKNCNLKLIRNINIHMNMCSVEINVHECRMFPSVLGLVVLRHMQSLICIL